MYLFERNVRTSKPHVVVRMLYCNRNRRRILIACTSKSNGMNCTEYTHCDNTNLRRVSRAA